MACHTSYNRCIDLIIIGLQIACHTTEIYIFRCLGAFNRPEWFAPVVSARAIMTFCLLATRSMSVMAGGGTTQLWGHLRNKSLCSTGDLLSTKSSQTYLQSLEIQPTPQTCE